MVSKFIGVKMPENEVARIERLVDRGESMNLSDFMRQAAREKLAICEMEEENEQSKDRRNGVTTCIQAACGVRKIAGVD